MATSNRALYLLLCIAVLWIKPSIQQQDLVCDGKLDVVFVLDSSGSIERTEFELMISTIENATSSISFGPDQVRVGVVVFSDSVSATIPLEDDRVRFVSALQAIRYSAGGTSTEEGIDEARQMLDMSTRGSVPKVIILITDGDSNNKNLARQSASDARDRGIDIWAVGIGSDLDKIELQILAGNQVFFLDSFADLIDGFENATRSICQRAAVLATCARKVDLVFVLDGSNSIGQEDFDMMIATLVTSASTLIFGPEESRVGAVLYSSVVVETILLQDDRASLVSELRALPYPDERTATDKGIDAAIQILDTPNPRNDTPRVIMLITDGVSDDPNKTLDSATDAKDRGIDVWAVGVGPEVDKNELESLVGNKTFFIDSYKDLPNRLQNATKVVCQNAEIPTTSPSPGITTPSPPPPIDLCPRSSSGSPVSFVPYPSDCTRVIQCYYNPHFDRVLAVTRQCPSGQFWDTATQACADSWTVNCPYDKCQKTCNSGNGLVEQNGLLTYPMVGSSCGAYWACKNQRSAPMCCPDHHAYNPETGCELSVGCLCEKDKELEERLCKDGRFVCNKTPIWGITTRYQIYTFMFPEFKIPCIFYGGFIVHECDCEDSGFDISSGCPPYLSEPVSGCFPPDNPFVNPLILPASGNKTADTVAYSFSFDLTKAATSIWIQEQCNGKNQIHIWQDGNEIKAAVFTKNGLSETISVFVDRNTPGPAEVTFQYSAGMFTLSISQGSKQHVAMERASNKFCLTCDRTVTIESSGGACAVTQVQAYDCRPNLNLVYGF